MHFNREELEKFRSLNGPLIDVRSPSEYYKGHMPNSINIPLFDNDERTLVGTIYKKKGKDKAVIEGLKIIDKKIVNLIQSLFESIKEYYSERQEEIINNQFIRIYCARGGMRSLSISWLLEKYKFSVITLKGGYKKYRKWSLDSFSRKYNLIVIGGKTGVGKTRLLNMLEKNKYQVIDLEAIASHRGSTFGALGMKEQPSNEQFENIIAEKLNFFKLNLPIFVEAESANIGKCRIPHEFFNQMKNSRRIEIIRSESNRLDELINTYSIYNQDELQDSVKRIKKRLGPQRTKIALDSINDQKWELVCKAVLEYYDKCYDFEKIGKNNIELLDLTDLEYNENILDLIDNFL